MKKQTTQAQSKAKAVLLALLAVLSGAVLLVSLVNIGRIEAEQQAAREEYDGLREKRVAPPAEEGAGDDGDGAALFDFTTINPDYVGWLEVPGTGIDYPVVRGENNDTYLRTTFEGAYNSAGAIFMDSANTEGFAAQHVIIYGHNMRDGTMFSELTRYLDAAFLAENPVILITTAAGETLEYRIFAARTVLLNDPAYQVDFADSESFEAFAAQLGAPAGTQQVLTLSTCSNSADSTERVLVHAVPIG